MRGPAAYSSTTAVRSGRPGHGRQDREGPLQLRKVQRDTAIDLCARLQLAKVCGEVAGRLRKAVAEGGGAALPLEHCVAFSGHIETADMQLLMRMREADEEMLALHRADVVEVLGRGLTAALAPAFDDASGWADGAPPPSEPPP